MKIPPLILCPDNQTIVVPTPHDLLKGAGRISALLPEKLFLKLRMMYRRHSYRTGKKTSPFELYRSEDIAFIHIPKNAGTFINSVVYPSLSPEQSTETNAHHSVQYLHRLDPQSLAHIKKFAILRHPCERLRSAFDYLKFKTPFESDRAFAKTKLARFSDFEAFCEDVTPEEFTALLDWPHFQPQISFICDPHGAILVDALTVFENMDIGMRDIGAGWGKDWTVVSNKATTDVSKNECASKIVEMFYPHDQRLWDVVAASPNYHCQVA